MLYLSFLIRCIIGELLRNDGRHFFRRLKVVKVAKSKLVQPQNQGEIIIEKPAGLVVKGIDPIKIKIVRRGFSGVHQQCGAVIEDEGKSVNADMMVIPPLIDTKKRCRVDHEDLPFSYWIKDESEVTNNDPLLNNVIKKLPVPPRKGIFRYFFTCIYDLKKEKYN